MAQRIAVVDLARELRVRSADIVKYAREEGMGLVSAAQPVSDAQAHKIRAAAAEGFILPPRRRGYGSSTSWRDPSDPDVRWISGRCKCCSLPYSFREDEVKPPHCDDCQGHYEMADEPPSRTIERLNAHLAQTGHLLREMAETAAERRQKMDAAYRSRDVWKRVLVEVAVAHIPGDDGKNCVCGAGEFPCATRRHLTLVNPGIAKEVERFEGLPEDDLQDVLYGDLKHLKDWEPID